MSFYYVNLPDDTELRGAYFGVVASAHDTRETRDAMFLVFSLVKGG